MKGFLFSTLAVWAVSAFAQTTLSGYVTLQNSGGKSAFPAQVKAYGATDTDVDRDKGYFRLIFDRKDPGDDVTIAIEREGYEVVNREALLLRLPHPGDLRKEVKFYLCPKGQWQQYADRFYHINLTEITKSYEKKLSEIQSQYNSATISLSEYRAALEELDKRRIAAESQAASLAEKFAKANLDDASGRFKLAYRLFSEGKIDSVLIILDEVVMLEDLERAEKEMREGQTLIDSGNAKIANGREALAANIGTLTIEANAYARQRNWSRADEVFSVVLQTEPLNIDIIDAYLGFQYEYAMKSQEAFAMLKPCETGIFYIRRCMESNEAKHQAYCAKWLNQMHDLIAYHPEREMFSIEFDRISKLLNK